MYKTIKSQEIMKYKAYTCERPASAGLKYFGP